MTKQHDDDSDGLRATPSRRDVALSFASGLVGACAAFISSARAQVNDFRYRAPEVCISPRAVARVCDLRRLMGARGETAVAAYHTEPEDAGGGMFAWSDELGAVDDGGTTLAVADGKGTRRGTWTRIAHGPVNVRWFGAQGDGKTLDDRAFNDAIRAAGRLGGAVYAPQGRYRLKKLSGLNGGFTLTGDGPASTWLCGDTSADHVIEITGRALNRLVLRDFAIDGGYDFQPDPKVLPSRRFHGLYLHDNHFAFSLSISNLTIVRCSGSGIRDAGGMFSASIDDVNVDRCMGHAIDLLGSCCITLRNCYVENVARDMSAYRIELGAPILIGCNGINHNDGVAPGTKWGEFGTGKQGPCFPTFIGCNIEAFTSIGCDFGGGSFGNFLATGIIHTAPTRALALRFKHVPHAEQLGIWDGISKIFPPRPEGSWGGDSGTVGRAIESLGNPFLCLNRGVASLGACVRSGEHEYPSTIPSITSARTGYLKYSLELSSALIKDPISEPPVPAKPKRGVKSG